VCFGSRSGYQTVSQAPAPSTPIEEAKVACRIASSGLGETLSELVTEYLAEIAAELTNQTVDEKRRHLDEYKKFVKYDYPIDEMLNQDKAYDYLTGYILKLNQSHETRSKKLRNVSGFYEWCMQRGYSWSNPFAGLKVRTVKGRKGKKGGRRAWKDNEFETLLQ
jgi:site-specific recombinase XerD